MRNKNDDPAMDSRIYPHLKKGDESPENLHRNDNVRYRDILFDPGNIYPIKIHFTDGDFYFKQKAVIPTKDGDLYCLLSPLQENENLKKGTDIFFEYSLYHDKSEDLDFVQDRQIEAALRNTYNDLLLIDKNVSETDVLSPLLDRKIEQISLVGENGRMLRFKKVFVTTYNGNIYCILKPLDKIENIKDDEAIVFAVKEKPDGLHNLVIEKDESISSKIFDEYNGRNFPEPEDNCKGGYKTRKGIMIAMTLAYAVFGLLAMLICYNFLNVDDIAFLSLTVPVLAALLPSGYLYLAAAAPVGDKLDPKSKCRIRTALIILLLLFTPAAVVLWIESLALDFILIVSYFAPALCMLIALVRPFKMRRGLKAVLFIVGSAAMAVSTFLLSSRQTSVTPEGIFGIFGFVAPIIGTIAFIILYLYALGGKPDGKLLGRLKYGGQVPYLILTVVLLLLIVPLSVVFAAAYVIYFLITLIRHGAPVVASGLKDNDFVRGFSDGLHGRSSAGKVYEVNDGGYTRTLVRYDSYNGHDRYKDDIGHYWYSDDNGTTFYKE